jgi:hypothetical protein
LALATLAAGCGSGSGITPVRVRGVELPGWKAVSDEPGIGELAPDVSGLSLTRRADSPALVRDGDVVRTTRLEFGAAGDAGTALARARASSFGSALEEAFRGEIAQRSASAAEVGYRLKVPRPAESGTDTVELYVIRRDRTLAIVELVSARGFDPGLRDRILSLVNR